MKAESASATAAERGSTVRVQFDSTLVPAGVTLLRREDALCIGSEELAAVLESPARMARDVQGLLKVVSAINSIRGFIGLERPLFELILDVIPAQRGLLVLNDDRLSLPSVLGWSRDGEARPLPICKQLTDRVLQESVAILSNDVQNHRGSSRRSAIAAPLIVFDRALGFIYLDANAAEIRFDFGHLHLLMIISGIAATVIENRRNMHALEKENQWLRDEVNVQHAMVGESRRMREIFQFIAKVAQSDSTVLLLGESGTGKELVARAIHQNSPRSHQPFVAINCAAITETLLESELFGYEKGAFTGAVAQTRGKLEVAEGGTVFLDEIGELAGPLQAKLLRVLQEHEFTRVGGTRPIKLDVRLVAATNRNLEEAARQGAFRPDLFYRLNVVSKCMPPLRDRREDVSLLANYFVRKYSAKVGRRVREISPQAEKCLLNYNWPGNVRELENAIEHAVVLGLTETVLPEDLPETVLESAPSESAPAGEFHAAVAETKRQLIRKALTQSGGNHTKAARCLGLQRNYLHRLIRNLNLQDEPKRPG